MSLNKHQAETLQRRYDTLWEKGMGESEEAIEIGQHLFVHRAEMDRRANEEFQFPVVILN